jgi:hypothetical protein
MAILCNVALIFVCIYSHQFIGGGAFLFLSWMRFCVCVCALEIKPIVSCMSSMSSTTELYSQPLYSLIVLLYLDFLIFPYFSFQFLYNHNLKMLLLRLPLLIIGKLNFLNNTNNTIQNKTNTHEGWKNITSISLWS